MSDLSFLTCKVPRVGVVASEMLPSLTGMFALDHSTVHAPIMNPHVNDDSQKPLVRRTWVFVSSTGYATETSESLI